MTPSVPDNPSRGTPTLDFWAKTWIGAVALILISCSFFSLFSLLRIGAWLGAALELGWTFLRLRRAGRGAFPVPRIHGIGWGIPVLLALCLVSLLAGPHCFLDTYSYRLPQMFFWLQEGHPWSVPGVDGRINQMPHVWPMLSAAFFLPLGERALALPNFIGLLFLAALFRHWAARAAGPGAKADALALVFLSAPIFLMGASTNDNVVCCCAFLALSYHFAARPNTTLRTTALSALSFALACGIKPQYLALAPVWAAWFFFAPTHPYRTVRLRPLLVLLPLLVLCSPVPTLAVNRICWGSFMHPHVVEEGAGMDVATVIPESETTEVSTDAAESAKGTGDRFRGEHAFFTLGSQLFAPPFNPCFGKMNRWVQSGGGFVSRHLRRNGIRFQPLVIPEVASLELFVFIALVLGLALALRHREFRPGFALPVLALTALAVAYTKGATLGRSFSGFFLLLFPIAIPALARLPRRLLSAYAALCLVVGVAVVITDPSRPLLPLRFLSAKLAGRPAAAAKLADYAHYSERQFATRFILAQIPSDEPSVGIVIEPNSPFAEIWLERPGIRVVPYSTIPDPSRLARDGVRYLIFKSKEFSGPGGLPNATFLASACLELLKTVSYVSFTSKGPEFWHLLGPKTDAKALFNQFKSPLLNPVALFGSRPMQGFGNEDASFGFHSPF